MSYYTVRRDDAELRVVTCPKCKSASVTKFSDVIPYQNDGYLLRLMRCNECGSYFTFYREDGVHEIDEKTVKIGIEKGCFDMESNGKDCHGHSFYILFKSKPPTISDKEYDVLMGNNVDEDGCVLPSDKIFMKWKKNIPSINQLVRYKKMLENIDFDSMTYLEDDKNEWFE